MKLLEKMPRSLLVRLVVSYLLMVVSFVYYFVTKDYWLSFVIVFVGFVVLGSGIIFLLPKNYVFKKKKTTYITKAEPTKTMADIKMDVEQMQEVWDELGKEE